MNKKEKTLCLRVINELIKSYKRINFDPSTEAYDDPSKQNMFTPSWLVEIKKEMILGKYLTLVEVIRKIKATLLNCLKDMGPSVILIAGILLQEQILHYEIQKLPRGQKNICKNDQQYNKSNPKATKMAMKRRGDKGYFSLQSFLLNAAIEELDTTRNATGINSSIVAEAASNVEEVKEKTLRSSKSKTRLEQNCILKQFNKEKESLKTTSNKKSVYNTRQCVDIPKTSPKRKRVSKKTAVPASNKTQKNKTVKTKTGHKEKGETSKVKKMLTLVSEVGERNKPKAAKKQKTVKLGKRKLPFNGNAETTASQADFCETDLRTEEQPSIKLKRMSCKEIGKHLKDILRKKEPACKPTPAPASQENQVSELAVNSANCLSTSTSCLRTSTPMKHSNPSSRNEIFFDFTELPNEESVTQTVVDDIHNDDGAAEKSGIKKATLVDNAGNHSVVVITEKGKYTKPSYKKKHSSKFQQKGNQLMGIEEEEIQDEENDDIRELRDSNKSMQEVTAESKYKQIDPPSTNINAMEHEYTPRSLRSASKASKFHVEYVNNSPSLDENSVNDTILSNGKEDDGEPEVLKVITKETYANIKHKILRFFDNIHEKNSDIRVEKVIVNETIPDDDDLDEDGQQNTEKPIQKEPIEAINQNYGEGKSSFKKNAALKCSKSSGRVAKSRIFNLNKRSVKVYHRKGGEPTNDSLIQEEDLDGDLLAKDSVHTSKDTINEVSRRQAEEWLNTELLPCGSTSEELVHMPEVPEISCFLHRSQKALRLPFFTHFEFELSLLIPHASCLMATVVTALLSGAPSSKETQTCSPLPYLQWNRKLTARLSHWFVIYKRLKSDSKVQDLIGIEPKFWEILGNKRNPLSLKPFHLLPIHQRVTILKGLCDHLFHVSKKIQTALISTPRGGREGNWLGEDNKGLKYIHIPIFLRCGIGDLRVYCLDDSKDFLFLKEQSLKLTDTSKLPQEEKNLARSETEIKEESNKETEISNENRSTDKIFSLVAENVEKLNRLVASICSPFAEEELVSTEKKLVQDVQKKEEICAQEPIQLEDEDDPPIAIYSDVENTHSKNEQLLLAAKLRSLAKDLNALGNTLDKSQAAALVKLHMEWIEFNKDGFTVVEKTGASDEKPQKRLCEKRSRGERMELEDDNFEEPLNIKNGQQPLPLRKSLSRKAKSNAGKQMLEEDIQISRREIVAEMEERALLGTNNLSEEERKWDTSLWADEDSDDDFNPEDLVVEESIWFGYAAIQKDINQIGQPQDKSVTHENSDPLLPKQSSSFIRNYTRKGSLSTKKNQPVSESLLKHDRKNGVTTATKDECFTDAQEEIKILSENLKGKRLNSYKIKISKKDLDSCLNKNEPGMLIDLVRKKMVQCNQINSKEINMGVQISGETESLGVNSKGHPVKSDRRAEKDDDVIEVQEINPSQSLTKKILSSFKRRKERSKYRSLGVTTCKSSPEHFRTPPLKVVQLKAPNKEAGGKAKLYSKEEMEQVTRLVLKAVNEINKHDKSDVPQVSRMETNSQKDCKICEIVIKSEANQEEPESIKGEENLAMPESIKSEENQAVPESIKSKENQVILESISNHNNVPDQPVNVNGWCNLEVVVPEQQKPEEYISSKASSTENNTKNENENPLSTKIEIPKCQSSGFKPFLLKSLNTKCIASQE